MNFESTAWWSWLRSVVCSIILLLLFAGCMSHDYSPNNSTRKTEDNALNSKQNIKELLGITFPIVDARPWREPNFDGEIHGIQFRDSDNVAYIVKFPTYRPWLNRMQFRLAPYHETELPTYTELDAGGEAETILLDAIRESVTLGGTRPVRYAPTWRGSLRWDDYEKLCHIFRIIEMRRRFSQDDEALSEYIKEFGENGVKGSPRDQLDFFANLAETYGLLGYYPDFSEKPSIFGR